MRALYLRQIRVLIFSKGWKGILREKDWGLGARMGRLLSRDQKSCLPFELKASCRWFQILCGYLGDAGVEGNGEPFTPKASVLPGTAKILGFYR